MELFVREGLGKEMGMEQAPHVNGHSPELLEFWEHLGKAFRHLAAV